MARPYVFPDPDDRSKNEPCYIASSQQVLGLYNQDNEEGDEMQTILSGYLNTLNEQNPETIGGQLPDEDFYYKR